MNTIRTRVVDGYLEVQFGDWELWPTQGVLSRVGSSTGGAIETYMPDLSPEERGIVAGVMTIWKTIAVNGVPGARN